MEFDGQSGQMKKITNMVSGSASNVEQQFYWYNGSAGNNKNSTQVLSYFFAIIIQIFFLAIRNLEHIYSALTAQLYSLLETQLTLSSQLLK